MEWFQNLPEKEKQAVASLAKKNRCDVLKKYREEQQTRKKHRQKTMRRCHDRRKVMREKAAREKEKLSHQHLITTVEFKKTLEDIDGENVTTSKKKQQKMALVRVQINIRNKLLGQKIKIQQQPLKIIIKELADFIADNPHSDAESILGHPSALVGKEILHKFQVDSGEESWFSGVVVSYYVDNNTHEILYDGESEHCHFDLTQDIIDGDLKIVGII